MYKLTGILFLVIVTGVFYLAQLPHHYKKLQNTGPEGELYAKGYKDIDLQIVDLAYGYTGKFNKDADMVGRYKKRFNIPWTLLVAGIDDKKEAAKTLPFLETIVSYPTSIFVDRDHTIRAIHVGFNGPATGSMYYQEIQRFKKNLNQIINS